MEKPQADIVLLAAPIAALQIPLLDSTSGPHRRA
jgi:hypothetical protein